MVAFKDQELGLGAEEAWGEEAIKAYGGSCAHGCPFCRAAGGSAPGGAPGAALAACTCSPAEAGGDSASAAAAAAAAATAVAAAEAGTGVEVRPGGQLQEQRQAVRAEGLAADDVLPR